MTRLVPVDRDPFETSQPTSPRLVPVDTDPFAESAADDTSAIERGFVGMIASGMPETLAETVEGVSLLTGPSELADSVARDLRAAAQRDRVGLERQVPSLGDIPGEGILDTLDRAGTYLGETLGEGLASTVPSVLTGIAGATIGRRVGGRVGGVGGAVGGAAIPSAALNYGDLFRAIKEEGVEPTTAAELAAYGTGPITALDVGGVEGIITRLAGEARGELMRGIARRIVQEARRGAVREGITEASQQAIQELIASQASGNPLFTAERGANILESAVAGSLTGGTLGSVAGLRPDQAPAAGPGVDIPPGAMPAEDVIGEVDETQLALPAPPRQLPPPSAFPPDPNVAIPMPDQSAPETVNETRPVLQQLLDDERPVEEIRTELETARDWQPTDQWQPVPAGVNEAQITQAGAEIKIEEGQRVARLAPEPGTRKAPIEVDTPEAVNLGAEVTQNPTPAQAEAGNYRKRHVKWQGFDIAIETEQGQERTGVAPDGTPWSVRMPAPYGYIKRTEGADRDQVDIYLGSEPTGGVFVVDQIDPGTGKFDEHKVMLGFAGADPALTIYNFGFSDGSGPSRMGAITPMTVQQFRQWLKNGNPRKPVAYRPPAPPKPTRNRQGAPLDLVQFLADNGGIQEQGGELAALDILRQFVPGRGRLVRKGGMTLDRAREIAEEAGYLRSTTPGQTTSIDDLLMAIDETIRGNRVYAERDLGEVERRAAEAQAKQSREDAQRVADEMRDLAKAEGYNVADSEIDAAVQQVIDTGADPLDALVDTLERSALVFDQATDVQSAEEAQDDTAPTPAARDEAAQQSLEGEQPDAGTAPGGEAARLEPRESEPRPEEPADNRQVAAAAEPTPQPTPPPQEQAAPSPAPKTSEQAQPQPAPTAEQAQPAPAATPEPAPPEQQPQATRSAEAPPFSVRTQEERFQRGQLDIRTELVLTDRFSRSVEDLQRSLRKRLDAIGLRDVGLRLFQQIRFVINGEAGTADGRYLRGMIDVALDASDPNVVVHHEALHAMRRLGLFTDQEWAVLARMSERDWMGRYNIGETYADFPSDIQIEEGIAHAYADWAAGKRKVAGIVARAFKKLRDFIEALRNALQGLGFKSASDVFSDIERGDVGARDRAPSDGNDAEALARSAREAARTAEFKRWFGDSEVVDENGEPQVLYHGTARDFTEAQGMFWGAVTPDLANTYARSRGQMRATEERLDGENIGDAVMPIYMRIETPFSADRLPGTVTVDTFFAEARKQAPSVDTGQRLDTLIEKIKGFAAREGSGPNYARPDPLIVLDPTLGKAGPHYARHDFWHDAHLIFGLDGAKAIREAFKVLGFDGVKMTESGALTYGAFSSAQVKSATGNRGTFDPDSPDLRFALPSRDGDLFTSEIIETVDGPREQTVLPGAERISERELAERQAQGRKRSDKPQKDVDGLPLFGDEQGSLFAMRRSPAAFFSPALRAAQALPQAKGTGEQMLNLLRKQPGVKAEELQWLDVAGFVGSRKSVTREELAQYIQDNQVRIVEITKPGRAPAPTPHGIDRPRAVEVEPGVWDVLDGRGDTFLAGEPFDNREDAEDAAQRYDEEGVYPDEIATAEEAATRFEEYTLPGGENYRELLLTVPLGKDDAELERLDREAATAFEIGDHFGADAIAEQIDRLEHSGSVPYRSPHFNEPNILAHIRFNERTDAQRRRTLFVEEIQSDWHQEGRRKGYRRPGQPPEAVPYGWAETGQASQAGAVPDAPLKKTWHETALRRMIRLAAENDFDRIAWTPGEVQADRYDLSRQVEAISATRNEDGTYHLGVKPKGGEGFDGLAGGVRESALSDHVGKDLADKIAAQKNDHAVYRGLDLIVGGEGMRGFYDKILPRYANKFGKRFGAKVSPIEMPIDDDKYVVVDENGKQFGPEFTSSDNADAHADRMEEQHGHRMRVELKKTQEVWSLPITDDMRQSVLEEGVPLFSMRRDPTTSAERQRTEQGWIARGQFIDRAMRIPFHTFGGVDAEGRWQPGLHLHDRAKRIITEAKINPDGRFGWFAGPLEAARAGLIDRYGLDPEFIARDRRRELDERHIAMEGAEVLKSLAEQNVGIAEAKVLQAILTGEQVSDSDLTKLAVPIRQAIDQLGEEAVSLGLVSRESYERNRGAYLHRVYMKHEADRDGLSRLAGRIMGARRKKLIGDAFRGRGIFLDVDLRRLVRDDPEFREARRGKPQKGEKFRLLEYAPYQSDAFNAERRVKARRRVWWPADRAVPARFSGDDWRDAGTWEVRGARGGKLVLWRDYSKAEREKMGEILDARYTIGKTYLLMAHDLATGRFYKDIAENETWTRTSEPSGKWVDGAEGRRLWQDPEVQWVKVPTTAIPQSGGKKRWGLLAGKWVRAEIWRDLNELQIMQRPNLWRRLLTQWKLNKTARSPVVHMNNVMSNMVFMDLADVRMQDLTAGIRSFVTKDEHYQEAFKHGAFGADMMTQEIRRDVLQPILEELQKQVQGQPDTETFMGKARAMGMIAERLWSWAKAADQRLMDAYRIEDELFRMATYIRRRQFGDTPAQAADLARQQFLDYDIRAPWVNVARNTVLPFIAYTYRAVPLIARAVAHRPWKLPKYFLIAYMLNALAYAWDEEGDEERERASLRQEEQGYTWIGTPRMLRMPYRDASGLPVFLDIRRWIPAGDVFDMNQGSSAIPIPAPIQFGGPLMLGAELALNKQAFTGRPITNDLTDDWMDKVGKVGDWAWKSWMPSAAWVPGSWYWTKIERSLRGATDAQGRPYGVPEAIASSVGIKLKPQDVDQGLFWRFHELRKIERELSAQVRALGRQRARNLISQSAYEREIQRIMDKLDRVGERGQALQETSGGQP